MGALIVVILILIISNGAEKQVDRIEKKLDQCVTQEKK